MDGPSAMRALGHHCSGAVCRMYAAATACKEVSPTPSAKAHSHGPTTGNQVRPRLNILYSHHYDCLDDKLHVLQMRGRDPNEERSGPTPTAAATVANQIRICHKGMRDSQRQFLADQ